MRHTCRHTKSPTPLADPEGSFGSQLNWLLTPKRLLPQLIKFQNSLIFIYSKIHYIIGVMSFIELLRYLIMIITHVPNFHHFFYFTLIQLMTRHEFTHVFGLPVYIWQVSPIMFAGACAWPFQFDLHFHPQILAS